MINCANCGEPLSEFEECSYGDLCMFCHDREESSCTLCQEEDCHGCEHEKGEDEE